MTGGERELTTQGLNETELDHFTQHCTSNRLKHFLLLSGGWSSEHTPRNDLTNRWNMPFYKGLYPELQDGDIPGYRRLTGIDGNAWLALRDLTQESLAEPGGTWAQYSEEEADKQVNGQLMPADEKTKISPEQCSELVISRVERGMSRRLRMLSAMVIMNELRKTHISEEIALAYRQVPDVLHLSSAEQHTASTLFAAS